MDIAIAVLLLCVVVFIVLGVARFVLKLTGRVVGCLVSAVIVIGAAIIIGWIIF